MARFQSKRARYCLTNVMNNHPVLLKLGIVCVGKRNPVCRRIPYSPNFLNMKHWAVRSSWKKAWEEEVWVTWLQIKQAWQKVNKKKLPFQKATLQIIVYCIRPQDEDNMIAACKPLIDGIRYCGIIYDDKPENLTVKSPQFVKVHKKDEEHVELFIQ